MPETTNPIWLRYGMAISVVILALLLTYGLWPLIEPSADPLFFAAVTISSWYGGLGPGLWATFLSAWMIDYFFMPPTHSLTFGLDDMLELSVFVLVALLISSLTETRRRLEKELKQRVAELAEADKRKNTFLAMLAHELRNPLTSSLNAVQILRLENTHNPDLRWPVEVVERQLRHMNRLVEDLLDISRITCGKIELCKELLDLTTVVTHALDTSRPFIEARKHKVSVSLPSEPLYLEADPVRLEQVLVNLLNNAAKYTDPGGQIWLTVYREGEKAVLRVRDTGIGIPPEMVDRIFDLFTQVNGSQDRLRGGLGIGLTLVRSLVELHGGKISAYSAGPGQGSEFVVQLPLLSVSPETPWKKFQPASGGKNPPHRRILVVDDNTDAAVSLGKLLKLWGHEVQIAQDGPTAIELATSYRPEVVLLDIDLPGINGYEVARRFRQEPQLSQVVLIALTGYGQKEDPQRAREAGFDHHFTKPINLRALQRALEFPG
ncbi:MAG TPA: ATP-binding protein [Candidatus Limnocylindrales bacterium]|nr:ATP-binding protein [Candidatus Limnocylindrales bacterium]